MPSNSQTLTSPAVVPCGTAAVPACSNVHQVDSRMCHDGGDAVGPGHAEDQIAFVADVRRRDADRRRLDVVGRNFPTVCRRRDVVGCTIELVGRRREMDRRACPVVGDEGDLVRSEWDVDDRGFDLDSAKLDGGKSPTRVVDRLPHLGLSDRSAVARDLDLEASRLVVDSTNLQVARRKIVRDTRRMGTQACHISQVARGIDVFSRRCDVVRCTIDVDRRASDADRCTIDFDRCVRDVRRRASDQMRRRGETKPSAFSMGGDDLGSERNEWHRRSSGSHSRVTEWQLQGRRVKAGAAGFDAASGQLRLARDEPPRHVNEDAEPARRVAAAVEPTALPSRPGRAPRTRRIPPLAAWPPG